MNIFLIIKLQIRNKMEVSKLVEKEITIPKHVAQYWFDFMNDRGLIEEVIKMKKEALK